MKRRHLLRPAAILRNGFAALLLISQFLPVASVNADSGQLPVATFVYGNTPAHVSSLALADVNGDGVKDYVLGGVTVQGIPGSRTFVVFNEPSLPQIVDLSNLGSVGYEIYDSANPQLSIGTKVADAGDLNGDGRDDILVTTFYNTGITGSGGTQSSYLIWGKSDTSSIDLANFNASNGVQFTATTQTNAVAMAAAAAVGDVNGDGHPALAFGDSTYGGYDCGGSGGVGYDCGKVSVIFGRANWPSTIDLDTLSQDGNGYNITGLSGAQLGSTVAAAGDVNGDGSPDIAISSQSSLSLPGPLYYVVFGASSSNDIDGITSSSLGSQGFVINSQHLGYGIAPVTGVGDVNGDGLTDLAVGANGTGTSGPPAVYTVFGKSDSNAVNLGGTGTSSITSTSFNDSFGMQIVNADGSLVVSQPAAAGPDGNAAEGRIYGFPLSSLANSFSLPTLNGGYVIQGASPNMLLGTGLADGSVNGDLFATVGNGTSPFVAVVVSETNSTVSLPSVMAPSNLTAPSPTNVAPALSWAAVPGATSYNVYQSGTLVGNTASTSFTDSSVLTDGDYTYTVTALDSSGVESSPSNAVTVVYDTTPSMVSNLTVLPAAMLPGNSATLSADVSDNLSGVERAEYFIGADPGQGNGTPLMISNGTVSATLGSNLSAGVYNINVRAEDGAGNWSDVSTATLTVEAAPTITSPSSYSTGMRQPITPAELTVTATGVPVPSLSESGTLPAGMAFTDNGNGTANFTGMAAAGSSGTYPITITATNSAGTYTQHFTLTVTAAASAPTVITPSMSSITATAGTQMTPVTFTASGYKAPKVYITGALPPGLSFHDNNDGTASFFGTPTTAGTYTFTVTASNKNGAYSQTFTIVVS